MNDNSALRTDRERVLTETLIEARDQLVKMRDHLLDMGDHDPAYIFDARSPSPEAWEVWDAMMQDAEDRGEGRAMARERIVVEVRWRPSASGDLRTDHPSEQ